MEKIEDFVSISEAAKILGLTHQRVGLFCRQGRFQGAKKIGYYWAIPKDSLEKLERRPHGVKKKKKFLQKEYIEEILKKLAK